MHPSSSETNSRTSSLTDIRAIKDPVEIPDPWFWLELVFGVVLVGIAAWQILRRTRRQTPERVVDNSVSPSERALQRLNAALALIGQSRSFCTQISDTVREYLEDHFKLHAPDRTTEEFIEELRSTSILTLDQQLSLAEFLARCDLVKFAKQEPHESELRILFEAALRLIEETQPISPVSDTFEKQVSEKRLPAARARADKE